MPKYTSSRDYDDESDDNHYGSADGDNESADSEHGSADDVVVPDSGCPVAKLLCWPNSISFKDITVEVKDKVEIGDLIRNGAKSKQKASENNQILNGIGAVLWYEDGKFFFEDRKSTSVCLVNNEPMAQENEEPNIKEIFSGDTIQFGEGKFEYHDDIFGDQIDCVIATVKLYLQDGKEAKVDLKEESSDKIVDENKNIEDFTVSDTKHSPKKRKIDDKEDEVDHSQPLCLNEIGAYGRHGPSEEMLRKAEEGSQKLKLHFKDGIDLYKYKEFMLKCQDRIIAMTVTIQQVGSTVFLLPNLVLPNLSTLNLDIISDENKLFNRSMCEALMNKYADKVEHLGVFGLVLYEDLRTTVHDSEYADVSDLLRPTSLSPMPKLKSIKFHEVDRESVNAILEAVKEGKDMVFDMKGDTFTNLTGDVYLKPQVGSRRVVRFDRPPPICLQSIYWGEDYEI